MPLSASRLIRPVLVDICKDGTISYRRLGESSFNGVALPVFSVNHEDQARQLQLRFGRLQYEEHPKMPGRPWYRWTDFPGTIIALDDVSDRCDIWYHEFILKQENHHEPLPEARAQTDDHVDAAAAPQDRVGLSGQA